MASKFGMTWWGSEWLRSLTNIDYENRIPRGARYARNGSVTELSIEGNLISAHVLGTWFSPYTVKVEVNKFTPTETDSLMEDILAHPAIVAELLNRNLSPAINDIAKKNNLKVFPSSWRDLGMHCSCPDWAVPCKHITAVIYKVGQEIDNNPFLIFLLHGVDIFEELRKRGITVDDGKLTDVPDRNEALGLVPLAKAADKRTPQELPHYDFTRIGKLGGAIMRLLPPSPPFYSQGDFLPLYQDNVSRMQKAAASILNGKKSPYDAFGIHHKYQPEGDVSDVSLTVERGCSPIVRFGGHTSEYSLPDLMEYMFGMSAEKTYGGTNSVFAFHTCSLLAINLAARGNVVPVINRQEYGSVEIVWTPLTSDAKTNEILKRTDSYFSIDSITATDGQKKLVPTHPTWFVTSCFLTAIMHNTSKRLTIKNRDVYDLFFKGREYKFNDIGEKNIPGAIKSWTAHLAAPQLRYLPIIRVRDYHGNRSNFLLEMSVRDAKDDEQKTIDLHDVFTVSDYKQTRYDILRDVSLLSPMVPGIDNYLAHEARRPVAMDKAVFTQFLADVVPAMQLLNIQLLLPKSLQNILRPQPSVSLRLRHDDGKSFLSIDQLLQFDWKVAIGKELLQPEEFFKLLDNAEGLIRFKQQYIYVTAEDIKRIEKALASRTEMTGGRMLRAALSGEYKSAEIDISPEVRELIKKWTTLQEVEVPHEIRASLRPYQKRGFEWMYQNMRFGFGSILADDMGLGKTLQVITLLQKLKDDGALKNKRALVIAPTGLLANWQAELQRFAPSLTVFVYHGQSRKLEDFDSDILLTSYGLVRSDAEKLKKLKWAVAVIDEAQNIKNSFTAQSKAVRSLKADTHIAMSGTPVENRLSEYWSVMDFANKGYLGSLTSFNEEYAKPIQQEGDSARAEQFRRITAPLMMRRLKTDKTIISDLPDKIEQDEFAALTPQQAAIYEQVLNESMKVIESIDEANRAQLFKRQGLILQMMLALKQICNHPAQFLKNGDLNPSLSGKSEMLTDLVSSIADARGKAIIFTQFKEMGDMLVKFIADATGVVPMFLHGGCPLKQRKEMIDRFQSSRADKFFVLTLKAAGTGLNLTAATHVIHYDLWWNPAVEAQATDRAYRIGQHQNVVVHRFITRDTFEERINDMIKSKRALAEMTVATGESWIGKLSNKELHEIFG